MSTPRRPVLLLTSAALTVAVGALPAMAAPGGGHGHGHGQGHGQPHGQASSTDGPPGNNGTIKVDGEPFDGGHRNDAHVGCRFAITFWGFDRNQHADITFTGQAPTPSSGPLLVEHAVLISTSPAGGGRYDGARYYTAAQLGLTSLAPRRQGWHVRVSVDPIGAPGGAKTKVFWVRCAPSAQPANAAATQAPAAAQGGAVTTAAAPAARGAAFTGGGGALVVTGTATAAQAQPVTTLRRGTVRPAAARTAGAGGLGLPFTGFPLLALLAAAGGLLVTGAAAVRAGRHSDPVHLPAGR